MQSERGHSGRNERGGEAGDEGERDAAVAGAPWSFRSALFAQGVLLAITPLLIVALIGGWMILPQIKQDIERQQQAATQAVVAQVETHLFSARRELVSVAALIESSAALVGVTRGFGAEHWERTDRVLDSVVGSGTLYEAIYLADRNGIVSALGLPAGRRVARRDLRGIDLSRRSFVEDALRQGEPVWSSAFLSAVSGRLSVALALPVRDGVLVAELALGHLSYFLRELPVGEQAAVLVVDRSGHVIAHPRPDLAGQQINLSDELLVREGFDNGRAFGPLKYEGRQMIGAALAISGVKWLVLVAQPVTQAYALIDAATVVILSGFAAAMLLALVLAFLMAAGSSNRLAAYARNAGQLASGNYDLDWPASRVQEFSRLATDLQRMAQAIKLRENDLRESQARYREVVQTSADLITRVDAAGRFLFVNQAATRVLGLQPAQCVGRLVFEFIHRDDREATREAFERWLGEKTDTAKIENRQVSVDGKVSDVVWSVHAHRNSAGEVVEFSSIGHDMTEYRRAEAEIRRLALVASATSNAVMICDAEGRVEWINAACESMTGFVLLELQGQRPWDRRGATDTPPAMLSWMTAEMRAGHGFQGAEVEVAHKNGRISWNEVEVQPVRGAAGTLTQFVVIESDITARRQAQDALKASEERLRATLENTPNVAIQWYDPDGRVSYWNQGSERLYGISSASALGRTRDLLIEYGADTAVFRDRLAEIMRTGSAVGPYETVFHRPDGSGGWALTTTFSIPDEAGGRRFVGMDVDITEQKKLSERLGELNLTLEHRVVERTAALASANTELREALTTLQHAQEELVNSEKLAALGALVAGVAHELNTPIGNGLMAATTLDDHAQAFDRELSAGNLRRSTLEHFVKDVKSATDMVVRNLFKASELLSSFKQVAVDRTSAHRRQFRLNELVSEIVLTLGPSFRKTPYRVDFLIPPDLVLDSYPGPLGQVLSNLINNALLHAFEGRDGGTVTIRAEAEGADRLILLISDDGAGIALQNLQRIFEPFFTTKLGRGGSGLGLHIVHRIVTRVLGGSIQVESTPAGTLFTIELPCKAPDSSEFHEDRHAT